MRGIFCLSENIHFIYIVWKYFLPIGITFPSGEIQKQLLKQVYADAGVDPAKVAYVEAHGTGTKAGDPQEVNGICDIFCKGRQGPLLIGSTKSNMGHPEPASGMILQFVYFINV